MQIKVETTLGSPAAECANFGVCSLNFLTQEEWDAFTPRHLRAAKAWLTGTSQEEVVFTFPRSGMLAATRATFFGPNGFRIDAPLPLPQPICGMLGLLPETCLIPGIYPVVQKENTLSIYVAVKCMMQMTRMAS